MGEMKRRKKRIQDYRSIHPFMGKFYYESEPLFCIQLIVFKLSLFYLYIAPLDGIYGFDIMGFGFEIQYY